MSQHEHGDPNGTPDGPGGANPPTPEAGVVDPNGPTSEQASPPPPTVKKYRTIEEVHRTIYRQRTTDLLFDSLALSARQAGLSSRAPFRLQTDYPVAFTSADHQHPRGAANDDTRHPRFVGACEKHFAAPIRHLDIGCAGGGLVWDFLLAGHASVGIEGSDYPLVNRMYYWRVIPRHLFTADATKPFSFIGEGDAPSKFDVITAWEVLEHIPEETLGGFLDNIRRNIAPRGVFVCSVATFPDRDEATGVVWHVTLKPREWWVTVFRQHGFRIVDGMFTLGDYVRGSGNPRAHDWNEGENPELGFHLVAQLDG